MIFTNQKLLNQELQIASRVCLLLLDRIMAHHKKKPLRPELWIERDGKYYPNRELFDKELERVIDEELRRRLGDGYKYLQNVFDGIGLDYWAAKHLEFGLDTSPQPERHNWKPWEKT